MNSKRAVIVAAAIAGTMLFAIGLTALVAATRTHAQASVARDRALGRASRVHDRLLLAISENRSLRAQLRAQRGRLAHLERAQREGFAPAVQIGRYRGDLAGRRSGYAQGHDDGALQRSSIENAGWYYVDVTLEGDLPVIASTYNLEPGDSAAYYVEGGKAYHRDTTTP